MKARQSKSMIGIIKEKISLDSINFGSSFWVLKKSLFVSKMTFSGGKKYFLVHKEGSVFVLFEMGSEKIINNRRIRLKAQSWSEVNTFLSSVLYAKISFRQNSLHTAQLCYDIPIFIICCSLFTCGSTIYL